MGQFSWITQDTNEAIRESYGCPAGYQTSAVMHDNQGNSWEEVEYEGYGVFGGKDFYELLAEMNGLEGSADQKRSAGIDLAFSDKPYISPNLTKRKDWKWVNRPPEPDPNQGWGECEDEDEELYG